MNPPEVKILNAGTNERIPGGERKKTREKYVPQESPRTQLKKSINEKISANPQYSTQPELILLDKDLYDDLRIYEPGIDRFFGALSAVKQTLIHLQTGKKYINIYPTRKEEITPSQGFALVMANIISFIPEIHQMKIKYRGFIIGKLAEYILQEVQSIFQSSEHKRVLISELQNIATHKRPLQVRIPGQFNDIYLGMEHITFAQAYLKKGEFQVSSN